jgi:hypothetical protein
MLVSDTVFLKSFSECVLSILGIKNWTFSEDLTIDEQGLYYLNVSK